MLRLLFFNLLIPFAMASSALFERKLHKNQVRVTSREIVTWFKESEKAGITATMRDAALHFMPEKYRWFENGEDFKFAMWLSKLIRVAHDRKKAIVGIYTFSKQGAC